MSSKTIQIKPSILKRLRTTQDQIANLQTQANIIVQGDTNLRQSILEMNDIPSTKDVNFDLQKGEIVFNPEKG